jgi:hypothetical protein
MGPPIPPAASHIGHHLGPATAKVHLAVFLDYCCPFSAKAYRMLFGQVVPHFGDRIRVSFYHQVQSWHPQSAYMHEAALAVAKVAGECRSVAPLSDAGLQRSAAERTAAVHQGIEFIWRCKRRCFLMRPPTLRAFCTARSGPSHAGAGNEQVRRRSGSSRRC